MDPITTMKIVLCIVGIMLGLQFAWSISTLYPIVFKAYYNKRKPWTDYNMNAIKRIIHYFALNPSEVKFTFNGKIISRWNTDKLDEGDPGIAQGLFSPKTEDIQLDTKLLRTHKSVVKTLLHEICHWNQWKQGRMSIDPFLYFEGNWAMEKEAEGFAKAWIKIAYLIYKNTPKEVEKDNDKV